VSTYISGRYINLEQEGAATTDVVELAQEEGHDEIVTLLRSFKLDRIAVSQQLMLELVLYEELSAELFALVIFVCDGLMQTRKTDETQNQQLYSFIRFFKITEQLPIELQMLLCHRVFGSTASIIASSRSESAFRRLARSLY